MRPLRRHAVGLRSSPSARRIPRSSRNSALRGYVNGTDTSATIRPGRWLMTNTRSLKKTASATLCVTNTAVHRCRSQSRMSSSFNCCREISSSAAKGSSNSMTSGAVTIARARETRIRMPPESMSRDVCHRRCRLTPRLPWPVGPPAARATQRLPPQFQGQGHVVA